MLVTGEHFIATGDDDGIIKVMLIYYNNFIILYSRRNEN